ncbi:MAG: DegT/DnrJ/EryC1/StrS family aminotransferase [Bacteroidota bacterium]
MKIHMVDVLAQHKKIQVEMDTAVREVLTSGAFINGPSVKQFRANLAKFLDVPHAISCANGTDALQVALMALDLAPGDEVITPSFTYVATVEVISLLQLTPVFVEVDPLTFNLSPEHVEAAITDRTKAIIPVHLFGQSADMEPIMKLAEKHNLYVVEDNAQAIGSHYTFSDGHTLKTGTVGHIGCTSFYPSKNLGACGDGGAMFSRDDSLADKIWVICNHGSKKKYYHDSIGVNSRLDSVQAAILDIKLQHLDEYNNARRWAASHYDEILAECEEVITPYRAPYSHHVFHQYTLRIKEGRQKRDAMRTFLAEKNIPSMVYYPVPLHLQGAYTGYGYSEGQLPVSEQLTEEVLSLPMHSELTEEHIKHITDNVKEALAKA